MIPFVRCAETLKKPTGPFENAYRLSVILNRPVLSPVFLRGAEIKRISSFRFDFPSEMFF